MKSDIKPILKIALLLTINTVLIEATWGKGLPSVIEVFLFFTLFVGLLLTLFKWVV